MQKVFYGRVPLANTWPYFLFEKSGKVQRLLHAIKYEDQKELARYIGAMHGKELFQKGLTENIDVIIPIPLHKKKLKSRGYNQSEWFAKGLGESISKPLDSGYLERTAFTSTQTRKNKYQRWENVEGIFKCLRPDELTNKHILLVDDVVTTGATIEAAHLAFKEIEGLKLSLASIAFAAKLR
ncbi:MAG: ComF family protein [Bacteroidia bacterium]|nr:ComF family protein [Bacteroidia bacterium]